MNDEDTNLMGRNENIGSKYPGVIERLGLLFSISSCILIGRWLWLSSNLPSAIVWFASICILPVLAMIVAELIGRITQHFHTRNH